MKAKGLDGIGWASGGQIGSEVSLQSRETRRFPRAFRAASANYSFPLIIDRDFPNQRRQEKRRREVGGRGSRGNANKTHVQLTNWQITSERWRRKPVGLGHGHMPAGGDAVHPVESPSAPPPCLTWVLLIAQLRHAIDVQRVNDGWLRPQPQPPPLPTPLPLCPIPLPVMMENRRGAQASDDFLSLSRRIS